MAEYHVGCGLAGIYAGTLKKNGIEWLNKSIVTREALSAAAEYLLTNGVYYEITRRGRTYHMTILEVEQEG